MKVELKTRNCLTEVSQSIHCAKRYYEMWWVLCGDTRPKYVDVMNLYNYCSRGLIGATFDASIAALYKVVETRNGTNNIKRLFELLKNDGFEEQIIEGYKTRLETRQKTIKGIRIIRGTVVGHSDENLLRKEAFKKAGIVFDQWKQLMEEIISIIDDIYDRLNTSSRPATGKSAKELEKMFQDLIAFHAEKQKLDLAG